MEKVQKEFQMKTGPCQYPLKLCMKKKKKHEPSIAGNSCVPDELVQLVCTPSRDEDKTDFSHFKSRLLDVFFHPVFLKMYNTVLLMYFKNTLI